MFPEVKSGSDLADCKSAAPRLQSGCAQGSWLSAQRPPVQWLQQGEHLHGMSLRQGVSCARRSRTALGSSRSATSALPRTLPLASGAEAHGRGGAVQSSP